MQREELYQVVDAILNHATSADLEVIEKAIERRRGGDPAKLFGFEPGRLAGEMAAGMSEQMAGSREMIRRTVVEYVEKMIRAQAPELSDAQVADLMSAWMPSSAPGRRGRPKREAARVPPELLETMVRQFVDFSLGLLEQRQVRALEQEMGEWQRRYWELFPDGLKELITLYLKGAIDGAEFEEELREWFG